MRMHLLTTALLATVLALPDGVAGQAGPQTGPLVPSFGPVFPVTPTLDTPLDLDYRVAFDVSQGSGTERVSTPLTTVARFLNMHAAAGVPEDRLGAAVVVHGPAVMDVLNETSYRGRHGSANPNAALLRELIAAGTRVIVCGQSAASQGVDASELAEGVELALSAMTAFVILQADEYRVNPW